MLTFRFWCNMVIGKKWYICFTDIFVSLLAGKNNIFSSIWPNVISLGLCTLSSAETNILTALTGWYLGHRGTFSPQGCCKSEPPKFGIPLQCGALHYAASFSLKFLSNEAYAMPFAESSRIGGLGFKHPIPPEKNETFPLVWSNVISFILDTVIPRLTEPGFTGLHSFPLTFYFS